MVPRKLKFEGADREHAKRAVALASLLSQEEYQLAKYIDEETGVSFSAADLQEFARKGVLPDDLHIKPKNRQLGWRIDARKYAHGDATPKSPWYYDHCFLRYYGIGPISEMDFEAITNEWQHTRTTFGKTIHDAGNKVLQIARTVHASPERYEGFPYIEISRSKKFSDYYQCLAFADGYWLHVFVTDVKKSNGTSIISISFTRKIDDDLNIPPDDFENLVTSPEFSPQ